MDVTSATGNLLELERALGGVWRNVPIGHFTSFKIGGPADLLFHAKSSVALTRAVTMACAYSVPYLLLGTGANILVGDRGFRGLVIKNEARAIDWLPDGRVRADSGAVVGELIAESQRRGLSGLEHFAGIPSSVGGALWQNLHFLAPKRDRTIFLAECVDSATILTEEGLTRNVGVDYFQFGYDDSSLHHRRDVAIDATFRLSHRSADEIYSVIAANLAWRRERHPDLRAFPSAGSIFKKIDGAGAGRLIDQCGLKGLIVGGAQVSPRHANFIVNLGGATARDVLRLVTICQERVLAQFGLNLEMEVGMVGEL